MNVSSNVNRVKEQTRFAGSAQRVWGSRANGLRNILRLLPLLGIMFLLTACNSTTVLLANFRSDTVGSPPASTQTTGTVSLDPGAGTVTVVAAPATDLPANNWVRISHPTVSSPQTAIRGDFSRFDGEGDYSLLAALYIPSGTGIVTVQFEPFGEGPTTYLNFLHLDFMPEGDVRVDDGPVRFGNFPRAESFTFQVNLAITSTSATAEITLLGGAASGNTSVSIDPSLLPVARKFGAVRFWMGFQSQGTFFVDDILVTRGNS